MALACEIDSYMLNSGGDRAKVVKHLSTTLSKWPSLVDASLSGKLSPGMGDDELVFLRAELSRIQIGPAVAARLCAVAQASRLFDAYLKGELLGSGFVDRVTRLYLDNKESLGSEIKDFYEEVQFFTPKEEWAKEDDNLFSDEGRLRRLAYRGRTKMLENWEAVLGH